jgi:hypothetical protein
VAWQDTWLAIMVSLARRPVAPSDIISQRRGINSNYNSSSNSNSNSNSNSQSLGSSSPDSLDSRRRRRDWRHLEADLQGEASEGGVHVAVMGLSRLVDGLELQALPRENGNVRT